MFSVVITSYKEPKTIGKAIESFINQKIKEKYELIVSAPDKETLDVAKKYSDKNKQIKIFQDPGKGKTYALNLLLPKLKGEIIILTDGDVYISENSISKILEEFRDKKIGCITGHPISTNPRDKIFGYWSHLLCYAAHKLRLKRNSKNQFLECSGYLWAFRNKVIEKIPQETAEDTIVPILFWKKGYGIKYVQDAKVYVKYPSNLSEFIDQKKRTAKAHETLNRYVDIKDIPRMKSLKNEIFGSYLLLSYLRNFREIFWTFLLFPLRFYIWMLAFFHRYIKKNLKVDSWESVKSTK